MPKQLIKFATVLALILFSTSLQAQIDFEKTDHGVNINFFNGYAISYKWNTTQDLNYRIYLGMGSSWTNDDRDSESESSGTNYDTNKSKSDRDNNSIYFASNLSFQFLFSLVSKAKYNIYLGAGPNISYSYGKSNSNRSENYNNDSTIRNYGSTYTTKSYGIGVISIIGIEAYLTKTITLFAESHVTGAKKWSNNDSEHNSTENHSGSTSTNFSNNSETTSGWSANIQLVKVGLGIYF